jgi:6-phospho-beta-glucosidase
MKITVIGGGGIRSLFLASSIARRADKLGISQVVFMDNDEEKLRTFGALAMRMAKRINPELDFLLTTDGETAVKNADYIITTIRPGGDMARVEDELTALSCGVIGQETTGAAGFSFAMRTIPVLERYCRLVGEYAKKTVKVFNFTNPAGLVTQALRDMGYDFTYGICDAPSGMLRQLSKVYAPKTTDVMSMKVYGLNHLSFFEEITLNGKDITAEIIRDRRAYNETDLRFFEPEMVLHLGCIPNEYLYYYYYPEKALVNIRTSSKTRGEIIRDINIEMMRELSSKDIPNASGAGIDECLAIYEKWYSKRENAYMSQETGVHRDVSWTLNQDEGGYAGVALKFIDSESGRGTSASDMVLCIPNNGAIPGLAADDIVEISCNLENGRAIPLQFGSIDPARFELIRRIKSYERLASRAIINKDIECAVDALMMHPLVGSYPTARILARRYFASNAEYFGA